jgi:hypothetical protein
MTTMEEMEPLPEEALFFPVIGDRVFLADNSSAEQPQELHHYFSTDDELGTHICRPFRDSGFGPLNLSSLIQFADILDSKLAEFQDFRIVYCVDSGEPRKLANALLLIGSYMVLQGHENPVDVWNYLQCFEPHIEFYRSSLAPSSGEDFCLSLLDCWLALARSLSLGWVEMYDMAEYVHYDNPLEGDMHWIIPDKLLAFRCPRQVPPPKTYVDIDGFRFFSPQFFVEPFVDMNVSTLIRLNGELDEDDYSFDEFENHGIRCVSSRSKSILVTQGTKNSALILSKSDTKPHKYLPGGARIQNQDGARILFLATGADTGPVRPRRPAGRAAAGRRTRVCWRHFWPRSYLSRNRSLSF